MIEFVRPQISDRELIRGYYSRFPSRSCERSFANNYLWAAQDNASFAEVAGTLVFKSEWRGKVFFSWPAGPCELIPAAVEALDREAADVYRQDLRFYHLTPEFFGQLEAIEPGAWQITYNRDMADYVYEREKLASLAGKKLHSKRNHINRFIERHPGWHFEPLTEKNAEDAEAVVRQWRAENVCGCEPEKSAESCIAMNSIRLFEELGLKGGILYTETGPVGYTAGEQLSDDTFVVHIEKADASVQGAYPMINREFVRYACEGYTYVNREEDTGDEGLRKAKLSYRPVFLVEKGIATRSK